MEMALVECRMVVTWMGATGAGIYILEDWFSNRATLVIPQRDSIFSKEGFE
jgi:hypothetical protein